MKLVRQAGAKTNDLAGDGSTTSVVLAQGLIAEGMKVVNGIPCMNISRLKQLVLLFGQWNTVPDFNI